MKEVDLSLQQFRGAWEVISAKSPARRTARADGVDYVFSGLPIAFFNIALVRGDGLSAERLQTHGRAACAWASASAVPWLMVVTHETLAPGVDATAALDACGLAPIMPLTGMIADHVAPLTRMPQGLELVVPDDDDGCAAIVDINAAAYGMDLAAGKSLVGRRSFWSGHTPVLGRANDAPACSAAVMMVDGLRYVALVATHPAQQRRGFAEAAMRQALDVARAAHGESATVLHATEAGKPVYERMGYRTISNHTVFLEKQYMDGH